MPITRRDLAAVGALALVAAAPPLAHAESADEAAVKQAIDDLTKAMMAADKAKLEMLVADQLSYGHSGGTVQNKAEFVSVIADKKTVYKTITLSEPTVSVVGNNAIARHTFAAEVEAGGQASSPKIGVLQVWVKDGGRWKLLARQAFKT
jgi:ketosteroid isomerase-like protein